MPRTKGYLQDVPINIAGGYYTARSTNVNAQTTINFYPEIDKANGKNVISLYPHVGTKLARSIGVGPHRGGIVHKTKAYFVSGAEFYSMDTNETATLIGTLNTNFGLVGLASNGNQGNQIMIVDGTDGWIYDDSADTLTKISDSDFPAKPISVIFQDSYFIIVLEDSAKVYLSTLNDGTSWVAAQFATAERDPDDLLNILALDRTVYLFGKNTTELWNNTGGDYPFEPYANGIIEIGTAAKYSVAKDDNHVYFLSSDDRGQGHIIRLKGTTKEIVSNTALSSIIADYDIISDAEAFIYQQNGHTFYQITFVLEGITWVYDITVGLPEIAWTQKSSKDSSGNKGRHVARTYTFFNGKHYVGDFASSNLLVMDNSTYTDYIINGSKPIVRERRGIVIHDNNNARMVFYKLIIDVESGVGLVTGTGNDPMLAVDWSDDGGHTWSNVRKVSIGKIGEYRKRVLFHLLGTGRERIFRIRFSDPVKLVLINSYARIGFRRY